MCYIDHDGFVLLRSSPHSPQSSNGRDSDMSQKKKKVSGKTKDKVVKMHEDEQVEWPQFPYTAEELAKVVVTPIKSEEAKKRLGISD